MLHSMYSFGGKGAPWAVVTRHPTDIVKSQFDSFSTPQSVINFIYKHYLSPPPPLADLRNLKNCSQPNWTYLACTGPFLTFQMQMAGRK